MNVLELLQVANWFTQQYPKTNKLYNALNSVLQHNATQPNQQPIEETLQNLLSFLSDMEFGTLSLQQLEILKKLEVHDLIGQEGASHVEQIVKTTTYDPASTHANIDRAVQTLNTANQKLTNYISGVSNLGISEEVFEPSDNRIVVRIGFKNEASIDNIADWKDSSREWYDIIRGVALAAGESPENTKVIGATNGSVILILGATCAVTSILALISTHITTIAKNVISAMIAREKLRQERLLTDTMAEEFSKIAQQKREEGIKKIEAELADKLPESATGEVKNALNQSIQKLIKFGEQGGDVDFVAPDENQEAEDADITTTQALAEMKKVRTLIQNYQQEREAVKLLENNTSTSTDE